MGFAHPMARKARLGARLNAVQIRAGSKGSPAGRSKCLKGDRERRRIPELAGQTETD